MVMPAGSLDRWLYVFRGCLALREAAGMDRRAFLALSVMIGTGAILAGRAAAAATAYNFFNRRIPNEAHAKMGELAQQGITTFSFTPTNGWVIVTETGAYVAQDIPTACLTKLNELLNAGRRVHCVAFPPTALDGWVITTDGGYHAWSIPGECQRRIESFTSAGESIVQVAFPPSGGNSWVVVGTENFYARNIDDQCYQAMVKASDRGKRITQVAFRWTGGGWVMAAEDLFTAYNIDPECYQALQQFSTESWLLRTAAFSPSNDGWSLYYFGQRTSPSPTQQAAPIPEPPRSSRVSGTSVAAVDSKASDTGEGGFLGKQSVAFWTVIGGIGAAITALLALGRRQQR
jgi:hypothetical protein